jgi:hypothetical protein
MEPPTTRRHSVRALRPGLTSLILDDVLPFRAREFLRGLHDRRRLELLLREGADYSFAPFLKYRCLFVHVPKAAGISVAQSLFGCKAGGHRSLTRYRVALGSSFVDRSFKFTVVRNPWDRLVSAYFFLKNGGMTPRDAYWSQRYLAGFDCFDDFVTGWLTPARAQRQQHLVPQCRYLAGRDGRIGVDCVGRFENLAEDFGRIARRLGISAGLAELNRSRHDDYRDYYSERSRRIVGEVYGEDVRALGYEF